MLEIKFGKPFVFIAILIGILTVSGCSQLPFNSGKALDGPDHQVIAVDPDHQTCQNAEDCTITYLDCSSCECGIPINLGYQDYYRELYNDFCADYSGPVCEMYCPPVTLSCNSGICTAEQSE